MVAIKSLLILTTTALAAVVTRDEHAKGYELLLSDLEALDGSVRDLTAAITAYTSGTVEAASIFAAVSYVNETNRKGYYDASSDRVVLQNLNDSITISNYVGNPIATDIYAGLDALETKKEPLVAAGLRQGILDGLNLLVNDHDTLSAAIAQKLNLLSFLDAGGPVVGIDFAIRSAIADFST
jgi:hypothetical protein